jgi:oligosaccharide reducing-end xylanase
MSTSIKTLHDSAGVKAEALAYPFNATNPATQTEVSKYVISAREQGNVLDSNNLTNYWDLRSYVYSKTNKLAAMEGWITNAIARNAWLIINLHGINKDGWQAIDSTLLDNYYAFAATKASQLWFVGVASATKYLRERQAANFTLVSSSTTQYVIKVTDNLADATFNYPLTLKTCVNSSWTKATVEQGTASTSVNVVPEGSYKYIYYNAVPDQGQITVTQAF